MTPIVFLDVESNDRAMVRKNYPDAVFVEASLTEKELANVCKDAEVISTFITTPFSATLLQKLPKLKLLCTRSVGVDHIDLEECTAREITVCNVPDYGSHVIAEHVFALLLSTLRHIHLGHERVIHGHFDYHGLRGIALLGKTIGIVGTGKIGRKVARIAHGFGMRILAVDQCRTVSMESEYGVRYVTLNEMLHVSDIVTLHVPATPETEHMINAATLASMKDGVILINTARGSLIDSKALLDALNSDKLSHALLDVLEHEENFEKNRALVTHPNVVATPHIAFYADDSMRNMFVDSFRSIEEWQTGKMPEHAVTPHAVLCDLPKIQR